MTKVDTTPGAMRVITADARQEAAGAAGEGVAQLLGARGLLPRSLSEPCRPA
ncbi:hypothetical protein [Streptomyces sp. NPDC052107]|uniref:hypothetical protein n=1 Tax=Streptomyces sp. NPDC052107 TaxID=3155632 RepID=UPI0034296C59